MKILVYSYRKDEAEYFEEFSKKYQIEIIVCKDAPTIENVELARGFECISIVTTIITSELVEKLYEAGVRFISTRTVGFDHIDIQRAEELGMKVDNVSYSPNSVADYTIMLILMATRKMKSIMERASVQDYSLKGVQGIELQKLTLGVIGTGRIGQTVIKHMTGFECEILAYDININENINQYAYAKYVTLEELFEKSDVITLHVPATEDNYHMINKASIEKMKPGVFIINTARGTLIDHGDLIQGIEQKKIGGAALDVIENESDLYYNDLKCEILDNRELSILKAFPNVIMTPHTAFYTDQAVSDMVENSILSCVLFMKDREVIL